MDALEGMDTVLGILRQAPGAAKAYLREQEEKVAEEIFNDSQKQVPVHYGALKASGHVEYGEDIEIGYGGPAAQYALFVHENLAAHHKSPTKAKFLEDPFNHRIDALTARVRDGLEGAVFTQYPMAPSNAAAAERKSAIAKVGKTGGKAGMTKGDVHAALQAAATGNKTWRRHRTLPGMGI